MYLLLRTIVCNSQFSIHNVTKKVISKNIYFTIVQICTIQINVIPQVILRHNH